MPEGDTIYRTASLLRSVLEGHTLHSAASPLPEIDATSMVGSIVASVESRGKHLLINLSDRRCLHSHMGMTGSWHVYGMHDRWRKPERNARIRLATDTHLAVCFTPKELELLTHDGLRRHRWLSRLGPDLLSPKFDAQIALQRLRIHNATPIGEAIMNQSVICGIGNVYKSELLFLLQLNPFDAVATSSDDQLSALLIKAVTLLRRNTAGGMRQTRFRSDGPKLWVYDRGGEPCLKCGERIQVRRQGDLGRSTYFCRTCQDVR